MAVLFTTPAIATPHDEERVVAALHGLGVSYLSRQRPLSTADDVAAIELPPDVLLSDIVRQPSARVRAAVIGLLLVRPEFWHAVEPACVALAPPHRSTLMLFYTAAVMLQRLNAAAIQSHLGPSWLPLPDLYSVMLGVDIGVPSSQWLGELARRHADVTGSHINWEGTYSDVAARVLRQWECEARWTS